MTDRDHKKDRFTKPKYNSSVTKMRPVRSLLMLTKLLVQSKQETQTPPKAKTHSFHCSLSHQLLYTQNVKRTGQDTQECCRYFVCTVYGTLVYWNRESRRMK